jgi:hypothetical protein
MIIKSWMTQISSWIENQATLGNFDAKSYRFCSQNTAGGAQVFERSALAHDVTQTARQATSKGRETRESPVSSADTDHAPFISPNVRMVIESDLKDS